MQFRKEKGEEYRDEACRKGWELKDRSIGPRSFTASDVKDKLEKNGDAWKDFKRGQYQIAPARKRLEILQQKGA